MQWNPTHPSSATAKQRVRRDHVLHPVDRLQARLGPGPHRGRRGLRRPHRRARRRGRDPARHLRRLRHARRRRHHGLAARRRRRGPAGSGAQHPPLLPVRRAPRSSGPPWACTARPSSPRTTRRPSPAASAPEAWICVYPFVRSYEWYLLPAEDRGKMLRDHGMLGREFPQVLANTVASFAFGDWEWRSGPGSPEPDRPGGHDAPPALHRGPQPRPRGNPRSTPAAASPPPRLPRSCDEPRIFDPPHRLRR